MEKNFRYYIDEFGGSEEDSYKLKTKWDNDNLEYMAEDAAEDYFHKHDGWESSWPLTFVILNEDFDELGQFVVEMEAVPQFWATKKLVSETL